MLKIRINKLLKINKVNNIFQYMKINKNYFILMKLIIYHINYEKLYKPKKKQTINKKQTF